MRRALLLLATALLGACAPRVAVRELPSTPTDPVPLDRRLQEYNAEPQAVRLEGRLRVDGLGTADFGARVRRAVGLRLDAVGGPFSTPLLSMVCRAGATGNCQAYLPLRRTAYQQGWGEWGPWFETLLLGRVPRIGNPEEARLFSDGRRVLVLGGDGGWRQEVHFGAGSDVPHRVLLSCSGETRLEMALGQYTEVEGHPFPGRISVRTPQDAGSYGLEFRRVASDPDPPDDWLTLTLPPDTAWESADGPAAGSRAQFPFWLPGPDG